ncbi:MAG: hypothetical protein JWN84_3364 [Nocardioides sp.]|nr:hypothetical protein [Nocardioides sp.]
MRRRPPAGVLVLPTHLTASARRVAAAAVDRGLDVVQCEARDVLDATAPGTAPRHLHAPPSYVDPAAGPLGVAPLEAPADWLATLPVDLTRRAIRCVPIREAHALRVPVFVKSPNDKSIPARVYADGTRLPGPDAVDPATLVLVSDVVAYVSEVRLHVLDGEVHAASQYAQDGRPHLEPATGEVLRYARDLLAAVATTIPSAIVVDVGTDPDGGWSVIEANAAWASGCYASDPQRVLDVVLRSAGPAEALATSDRAFVRPAPGR